MDKFKNFWSALSVYGDIELGEDDDQDCKAASPVGNLPKKSVSKRDGNRGGKGKRETLEEGNKSDGARLRMPLVWIDLEMSGLDLEKDRVLEIACIVTDGRLEKMIEGPALIIHQPEEVLTGMGDWCQEHHTASGLVEAVRSSTVSEKEAEDQVVEFVRQHTAGPGQPLLAGNSVYVDYMFLRKYMPTLAAEFPHVLVDVSSLRAMCVRWYPKDAERAPAKKKNHRALEDIKESIAELKYMQKSIFKQRS